MARSVQFCFGDTVAMVENFYFHKYIASKQGCSNNWIYGHVRM